MELRIFVEPQQGATYDDQLAVARRAEECGYAAFYRSDHYLAMGAAAEAGGLPGPTDAWINGYQVVRDGLRLDFDESTVRTALAEAVVELEVALGVGDGESRAWGCDLSRGYIEENAAYYSS